MQDQQITVYQPSNDLALSNSLNSLEQQFIEAARRNVQSSMDVSAYTAAEIEAVTRIEALRLVNGMDLAAMNIRYRLYRDIRDRGLWTVDPRGFQSLQEMANEVGISISQLDNIIDLMEVIFPWLQDNLGVSIPLLFENVGMSNLRELVPVLKVIISGQPSGSRQVNAAADNFMNDVAATARAAGQEIDEQGIRTAAVQQLMEAGRLPNRELRQRIRPDRTPPIQAAYVNSGGRRFLVAEVDQDQQLLITRKMGTSLEYEEYDLGNDPHQRQQRARQILPLRRLMGD